MLTSYTWGVTLKVKFFDEVTNWKLGKPIPLYLDLSSNTDLKSFLDSTNRELYTNIGFNELRQHGTHLYLDHFNQIVDGTSRHELLVKDCIEKLTDKIDPKILVAFDHSDPKISLPKGNNYRWFEPDKGGLVVYYIAPLNYNLNPGYSDEDLWNILFRHNNYRLSFDFSIMLKILISKDSEPKWKNKIRTEIKDEKYRLLDDPPLDFYNCNIVKKFLSEKKCMNSYINHYLDEKVESIRTLAEGKCLINDSKDEIEKIEKRDNKRKEIILSVLRKIEIIDKTDNEGNLKKLIKKLGKSIVKHFELKKTNKLTHDSELFKIMGYDPNIKFKNQIIFKIFSLLPLKINIAQSDSDIKQLIEIKFNNNRIFKYFENLLKKSWNDELANYSDASGGAELNVLLTKDVLVNTNALEIFGKILDKMALGEKVDNSVINKHIDQIDFSAVFMTEFLWSNDHERRTLTLFKALLDHIECLKK